jgi:ABC-2 type transport system ATP-binding protein
MGGRAGPWDRGDMESTAAPGEHIARLVRAHPGRKTLMPLIEVQNLVKHYGDVRAVDDLSFGVESGTITGFLGPNGSGKTTTLRALLGLLTPTSGTATIGGRSYRALAAPLREVGAMLEAAAHPSRSARNHLRILSAEASVPRTRVEEMLRLVELDGAADRRVGGFSLGMRQRLGLAGALIGDPGILVLDEPSNGLDPEGIRWLRDFLRSLAAEGRTILLSSHVLAEVAQTVDDVVVISSGRVVAQAPLDQLTSRTSQPIRVRSAQPEALAAALRAGGLEALHDDGDAITVTGASQQAVAQLAFDHGVVVYEITAEASSLEDVFFTLTNAAPEEALR